MNGTPADLGPPLAMAAARFALAAILLLPVVLLKRLRLPTGRLLRATAILPFVLIVLPTLLLVWARRGASSETITVFFAAMPLIVVLFMSASEGRSEEYSVPAPRRAFYASLFGLGGIALAVWSARSFPPIWECAALLLAVISTAVATVYAKRELGTGKHGGSPWMSALLQMALAAVFLGLASALTERGDAIQWSGNTGAALLYLGVLSAAGYAIYFWLLKEFQAYQMATLAWATPFVALLESAILWREKLSADMLLGLAFTIGSFLVVMYARAEDDQPLSLSVTD